MTYYMQHTPMEMGGQLVHKGSFAGCAASVAIFYRNVAHIAHIGYYLPLLRTVDGI
jgi:hypothetical protein